MLDTLGRPLAGTAPLAGRDPDAPFRPRQHVIVATATLCLTVCYLQLEARWALGALIANLGFVFAGAYLPKPVRIRFYIAVATTYLPFLWLLWDVFPWGRHRVNGALASWPIWPGMAPITFLFNLRGPYAYELMGLATLLIIATATYVAGRRPYLMIPTAIITFVASALNAVSAYTLING